MPLISWISQAHTKCKVTHRVFIPGSIWHCMHSWLLFTVQEAENRLRLVLAVQLSPQMLSSLNYPSRWKKWKWTTQRHLVLDVCQPQVSITELLPSPAPPACTASAACILMFPGCLMKLQEPGVVLVLEALWGFGTGMVLMCWEWSRWTCSA